MMSDVLDFTSLFPAESEAVIRARWEAWVNEGLGPEDVDRWTDVREGSWFWISTTPQVREFARAYDSMGREVPASALPQWSWGVYLDDIGETRGLRRLTATTADGQVRFEAPEDTVIPAGTRVGVEPVTPEDDAPSYIVTTAGVVAPGETGVTVPVVAETAGTAGNVGPGAVAVPLTPLPTVTLIVNDLAMVGGTDDESDSSYRRRIVETFSGPTAANAQYYRQIALNTPGIGRAAVVSTGPGTFSVIISTAAGDPVASGVVEALQVILDPVAGQGAGLGQVGATITVLTASTMAVDVAATVEFETGYSLNGGGGTLALHDTILAALAEYIDGLQSGQEVVISQVAGIIARIQGVHDVGSVRLSGLTVNLPIPTNPPQVPTLGSTDNILQGTVS
jgi:uncharacterized phage protein gp47/JayE